MRNNYLPILKRGREGSRLSCRADNDDMHVALDEKLHTINLWLNSYKIALIFKFVEFIDTKK